MTDKLRSEDARKLHLEINQGVNQRFLIGTVIFPFFATLVVLMAQSSAKANGEQYVLTFSSLVMFVVFLLYLQSHFLRRIIRILGTYLILVKWSDWEKDWKAYRRQGYFAYTKAQTVLFIFLLASSAGLPFLFAKIDARPISLTCETTAFVVGGVGLIVLVWGMGFYDWFMDEAKIEARWKKVLRQNTKDK